MGSPSSSTFRDPPETPKTIALAQDTAEPNIFSKYKDIKQRNEIIKASTHTQFWKQTVVSQDILLSAFDSEKAKMQIEFLEVKVAAPRSPGDYKESVFTFGAQHFHPIDQMELHRQTSEIMYSTLTNTAMYASKLQVSLTNI